MIDLGEEVKTLCILAFNEGWAYRDFLIELKRRYIIAVLDHCHGNYSKAARALGMHRNTLARTMHELNIQYPSHHGRPRAQREAGQPEASAIA